MTFEQNALPVAQPSIRELSLAEMQVVSGGVTGGEEPPATSNGVLLSED